MPRLTELHLTGAGSGECFSAAAMRSWLDKHAQHLLVFDAEMPVEPAAVRAVALRCSQLQELTATLSNDDQALLTAVLSERLHLQTLRLSAPSSRRKLLLLTTAAPPATTSVLDHVIRLSYLRRLELRGVGDSQQLREFTFPSLRRLDVSGPLAADVDLRNMPELERLALAGSAVTTASLARVLKACAGSLTELHLQGCEYAPACFNCKRSPYPCPVCACACSNLTSWAPVHEQKLPRLSSLDSYDAGAPLSGLQLLALIEAHPQLASVDVSWGACVCFARVASC